MPDGAARDWARGRPLEVAPRLLNAVLRHEGVAIRITEVEAYDGANDPGSHAYKGKTPRNAVMFGPPGRLYVYFTYGMHHCMNLVTGPDGDPGAVLIRAGEVVEGIELARERRSSPNGRRPARGPVGAAEAGRARPLADRDLARGPARLCKALAIDRSHDGVIADIVPGPAPVKIETGPRVGLRLAADRPWRFWIPGDPTVSRYVPAKPRPR